MCLGEGFVNEYFQRMSEAGRGIISSGIFSNTLGSIIMNFLLHIKIFACNTRNAPRSFYLKSCKSFFSGRINHLRIAEPGIHQISEESCKNI